MDPIKEPSISCKGALYLPLKARSLLKDSFMLILAIELLKELVT